jgi:hypothetical protein
MLLMEPGDALDWLACGYSRRGPYRGTVIRRVDIDDPSQYEKDPLDLLRFAGDALDLYADGGNAPYAFGDGDQAEAWLVPAREYDELARALTWGHARDALDANPNTQEMYDQATRATLDRAQDSRELDRLQTMQLEQ